MACPSFRSFSLLRDFESYDYTPTLGSDTDDGELSLVETRLGALHPPICVDCTGDWQVQSGHVHLPRTRIIHDVQLPGHSQCVVDDICG